MTESARTAELRANLQQVLGRIRTAATGCGRDPAQITLVAVTKTFPVQDVQRLAVLGVTDFGENRDQEAREKADVVPQVRWHFVGRLQRNKVRSVVTYADMVHSVDRTRLVDALAVATQERPEPLEVLVQVSLETDTDTVADTRRGGADPATLPELADRITAAPGLRLAGLMAVPPVGADADAAFARAADIHRELCRSFPQAHVLSAGMSADLEMAIRHGATHVRVGTALLGGRPPVVG